MEQEQQQQQPMSVGEETPGVMDHQPMVGVESPGATKDREEIVFPEEELETINIVLADFAVPEKIWDPKQTLCEWKPMIGQTMTEVVEYIELLLSTKDKRVNLVVLAFQNFCAEESQEDVTDAIDRIFEAYKLAKSRHWLSIATLRFVPDEAKIWHFYANINRHIRRRTVELGFQPLSIHKCLLMKQNNQKALCVDPTYYEEFHQEISLGSTMTLSAMQRIISWILKHMVSITKPLKFVSSPDTANWMPTPPGLTDLYKKNPKMVAIMQERDIFVQIPRSRSTSSGRRNSRKASSTSNRAVSANKGDKPKVEKEKNDDIDLALYYMAKDTKGHPEYYCEARPDFNPDHHRKLVAVYDSYVAKQTELQEAYKKIRILEEDNRKKESMIKTSDYDVLRLRQDRDYYKNSDYWNTCEIRRLKKSNSDLRYEINDLVEEMREAREDERKKEKKLKAKENKEAKKKVSKATKKK